jgi:hypothetical protein
VIELISFAGDAMKQISLILLSLLVGCEAAPDSKPTHSQRQDEILKDPFGFKSPRAEDLMQGDDADRTDISGGGINHLDKKGLQRDIDSVLGR